MATPERVNLDGLYSLAWSFGAVGLRLPPLSHRSRACARAGLNAAFGLTFLLLFGVLRQSTTLTAKARARARLLPPHTRLG